MLDKFTQADATRLVEDSGTLRVSIFAPMVAAGQEVRQNPIRLKNALRELDRLLERYGPDREDQRDIVKRLSALLDDDEFWQHQGSGLAVFAKPGHCECIRVGISVRPEVHVAGQFHVVPLVPLLTESGWFYLLALSRNHVRLFAGDRFAVSETDTIDAVPKSLEDAVGRDTEEQHLQFHSGRGARSEPIYHGQGGGKDDEDAEVSRFCRLVAEGVFTQLRPQSSPLLLAGDKPLIAAFREAAPDQLEIMDAAVAGNYDHAEDSELHELAWPLVQQRCSEEAGNVAARYEALQAQDQTTATPDGLAAAAREGRIDTLLIADPADQGTASAATGTESPESAQSEKDRDDGRINELVAATWRNGGEVRTLANLQMPVETRAAAILRY